MSCICVLDLGFIRLISSRRDRNVCNERVPRIPRFPTNKKTYKRGIEKFLEFYCKDLKTFLREKDPSKIIERYYVLLRKKYTQNSCRALTNPIIQYAKYNGIQLNIRKSLGIYHTTLTTRDHMLQVDEAREIYKTGSLGEKVIVKTWLLGLRIGD